MSRSETSLPQEAADPSSGVNENHAHGEAGRASQSGPSENHIGLDSSRLNPAGRSDHLTATCTGCGSVWPVADGEATINGCSECEGA